MKKLRKFFIDLFIDLANRLSYRDTAKEYQDRYDAVKLFIHEYLPFINEEWQGKAIIEGGIYNYFELPDGSLPKYDFVLPEIPLYVVVSNIMSAQWLEAKSRGIKRADWEAYQRNLTAIEAQTPNLSTLNQAIRPIVLIIRWEEPVNSLHLAQRIENSL